MVEHACQICGKILTLKNWQGLNNHLRTHKMSTSEYWDIYQYPVPAGEYGIDYVTCPICNNNKPYESLTQHIIAKHGMQTSEFLEKFPGSKLFTAKYSRMRSDNCSKGCYMNWARPDYRVKKIRESAARLQALNKGSKRPAIGEKLSKRLIAYWQDPKYRQSQSEKTKRQHSQGNLTRCILAGQRKNWVPYTTHLGQQVKLKSSWELRLAKVLDENLIPYEYEKRIPYYDTQRQAHRTYYADFYLPNSNLILEIKANWATSDQTCQDKRRGAEDAGYAFQYFTEDSLPMLDSKEWIERLTQGNAIV